MKNVKIYGILLVYFSTLLAPTNIPKRPFVKIYRQFGLRLDTGSGAKVESRKANGRFPRRGEPSLANRQAQFGEALALGFSPKPLAEGLPSASPSQSDASIALALGFKPLAGGLPLAFRLNEGQHIYAESLPIGQHEIYQSQRSKARSLRLLPFWTPCACSPLPLRGPHDTMVSFGEELKESGTRARRRAEGFSPRWVPGSQGVRLWWYISGKQRYKSAQ